MAQQEKSEWFFCIVQDPGAAQGQLMGFKDDKTKIEFIPAFKSKEEAQQCFLLMPKDVMNLKYEVQAIIKEDIFFQTKKTGHKIFLMDDKGQIIKELEE
jgi:hypothetical protein